MGRKKGGLPIGIVRGMAGVQHIDGFPSLPVGSFSLMSIRVYLAMLVFRPPHRPLSEVTATLATLGAVTAARGRVGGG